MRVTSHLVLSGFILVTASAAGCGREEPEVPPAAAQSQSTSETERPAMVTGCLRAGDAADTFVLTTSRAEDGTKPVTYHLTGDPGVNLQDHIGERIQVTGIVDKQAQIAVREAPKPAENATGTAGSEPTPTVQTGAQLSIQRLKVTSVKPADGECEG
ncbi:MAG TPA: hypothetical protein VGD94_20280 [Vicinamibacterales bacterium]